MVLVNCCFLCKKSGESVDHILMPCEYSRELWYLVLCLFGVQWVMPECGTFVGVLEAAFW